MDRNRIDESVLRAVLRGASAPPGESFFRGLVRHLAAAVGTRFAFVTERLTPESSTVRTLAFWRGDDFGDDFEYDLSLAGWKDAFGNEVRSCADGLRQRHPDIAMLEKWGADSLVGIPLIDSTGRVVGHLAALDTGPISNPRKKEWILELFAVRAAAEIERKRAEQKLRDSERRYCLATAAARTGVWDWDVDGDRFYLDPNVKVLLGYEDEEIPNDLAAWSDRIHPEDRETVGQAIQEHLEGNGSEFVCEHRMLHKDGSVRWIMARGHTTRDEAGRPVRMVGTDTDITERKHLEIRLQRSDSKYRLLVEQLPAVVYVTTPNASADAEYVSPQIEALTGFSQNEWCVTPSRWRRQLHPEDRDRVLAGFDAFVEHNEPWFTEYRLITRGEREIWVRDQATAMLDADGRPIMFQGLMTDITARKKMDQELMRSQKLDSLSLMAGGLSHEFNNLLTTILANTSLARAEVAADSPLLTRIEPIETAVQRAAGLTSEMLAFSGKGRFVVSRLQPDQLIRDMVPFIRTLLSSCATLRVELEPRTPRIEADASQLRQALINLIDNANEALLDRGGEISIRTGAREIDAEVRHDDDRLAPAPGSYAFIEVADDGAGIEPAVRNRAFDPFFSTRFTGRGLGLSAVQGIVRGHGGAIELETEPDRGTVFRMLFPIATSPSFGDRPEREVAPPAVTGRTVLVVDDDEGVQAVSRSMLEESGFEVLTAGGGGEGVELFREHAEEISVVLLDLTMPRVSGDDVLVEIRRVDPEACVILMSGYSEQRATSEVPADDLAGFLRKPFRSDDLLGMLNRVLGTRS